jgi:monothiol glutaredoxin
MGIRSRLKKLIPIVGAGSPSRPIRATPPSQPRPSYEPEPEPESPRGALDPTAYIDGLVKTHPVVLFMKGSPASPACGFSASASAILAGYVSQYHTVDVLIDPEVRESVKSYANWPTIPQLFVGGELVGGSDIVNEMHNGGELGPLIKQAQAAKETSSPA